MLVIVQGFHVSKASVREHSGDLKNTSDSSGISYQKRRRRRRRRRRKKERKVKHEVV